MRPRCAPSRRDWADTRWSRSSTGRFRSRSFVSASAIFWASAAIALGSCVQARSGYHSAEFFTITHGTSQVSGFTLPPRAWEDFGRLPPGTDLVVAVTDFDAAVSFEAVVSVEAGGASVLVLGSGTVSADAAQLEVLGRVLGAEGLAASTSGERYVARVLTLGAIVSTDPSAGLDALAAERGALMVSHVGELMRTVLRHDATGAAELAKAAELCLRPPAAAHVLRGFLEQGGVRRVLQDIARHGKASRELVVAIAKGVMERSGDRELVVRACIERKDLVEADLAEIAAAAMGRMGTSGERAAVLRVAAGHASAGAALLRSIVEWSRKLEYDADRRDVLMAVAATAWGRGTEGARLVLEAAEALEFESHRKDIQKALGR